jgi:hypothetical protein
VTQCLVYSWICRDYHTIRDDPKKFLEQQRCSVSQERCSIEQQSNAGENPDLNLYVTANVGGSTTTFGKQQSGTSPMQQLSHCKAHAHRRSSLRKRRTGAFSQQFTSAPALVPIVYSTVNLSLATLTQQTRLSHQEGYSTPQPTTLP